MNVEMMGVNAVRQAIDKTDYLISRIKDNDRDPSWDGEVEVYRKAGDTHAKEDLILKVPVQVKGHKENNLKKKTIKYSAELPDLRNYLNAGGTVFMVVYINEDGDRSQIYYNTLLPFELRHLVSKYGEQKTKQIDLKALPKKKDDIAEVFLFAAMHMKKQRPAISCDLLSFDDLMKTGQVTGFNLEFTRVPGSNIDPLEYMFDHDTYIYAKLPFGLELPIEHVMNIEVAGTTIDKPVSVNDRIFYSHYEIVRTKTTAECRFGKSTRLITDKTAKTRKFNFKASGTLSERITDMDFIIHAMEAGSFKVGNDVLSFDSLKFIEPDPTKPKKANAYLSWLRTLEALLKRLGVTKDLDFEKITAEDEKMLSKLAIAILRQESVEWIEPNESFPDISISNITVKLCALPDEKKKDYCQLYAYSNAPIGFSVKDDKGNNIEVSYHVCLRKESMLRCSNIDYSAIIRQVKTIPSSEEYSSALVNLLLEMLRAYDESNSSRTDILNGAIELADWLRSSDNHTTQDLLDLNYYQAVKRSRALVGREIQALHSIIEGNPIRKDVYVGAYLLLDDHESAMKHYDSMDHNEQDEFLTFPISHFLSVV